MSIHFIDEGKLCSFVFGIGSDKGAIVNSIPIIYMNARGNLFEKIDETCAAIHKKENNTLMLNRNDSILEVTSTNVSFGDEYCCGSIILDDVTKKDLLNVLIEFKSAYSKYLLHHPVDE